MTGPVLVINPNSNPAVTAAMDTALDGFRHPGAPEIDCVTLEDGPFGIQSQADADSVVMPLARLVAARRDAAAIVIGCYSDPGIDLCREVAEGPVYGIQECGVLTALATADRFGVIAIAAPSILRHRRYMRRMGVLARLAGERALDISVADSAEGAGTFAKMEATGAALKADGADVLVLGCAGMARHRGPLEQALGLPVIDPTQAAVAMALGALAARAKGRS